MFKYVWLSQIARETRVLQALGMTTVDMYVNKQLVVPMTTNAFCDKFFSNILIWFAETFVIYWHQ